MQLMTHPVILHGLLQVVVDPGDDVGIEARQGKEGGGRGGCTKWVHLPGELWPDPKCFIEKAVPFCKETARQLDLGRALRTRGPVGAAEGTQEAEQTKEEQLEETRKARGWWVGDEGSVVRGGHTLSHMVCLRRAGLRLLTWWTLIPHS